MVDRISRIDGSHAALSTCLLRISSGPFHQFVFNMRSTVLNFIDNDKERILDCITVKHVRLLPTICLLYGKSWPMQTIIKQINENKTL